MLRAAASFDAQATLGFLVSQTSAIEQEVYAIRYADIQYPNLVPVDTSAYPWARTVTYFTVDQAGQADWMNGNASDMPFAEIDRAKYETTVEAAKIGYRFTLEEVNQAMMIPGMNLPSDKAAAAKRAADELVEKVVITGDARKGFQGLVNQTSVPQTAVPNGAASSPLWANKTPGEILADVNNSIVGRLVGDPADRVARHGAAAGRPVRARGRHAAFVELRHHHPELPAGQQPLHRHDRPAAHDPHLAAARGHRGGRHQPDDHLPA